AIFKAGTRWRQGWKPAKRGDSANFRPTLASHKNFLAEATNCVWITDSIVCGRGFKTAGRTREVEVGETFEILMQRSALKFPASFFKAAYFAALTIAKIPALIARGSEGHAVMTVARSGSEISACSIRAPDFAPL
ncbi:MAG: hypothetical protein ACK6DB_05500, partial [Planctomycetota bacterium]